MLAELGGGDHRDSAAAVPSYLENLFAHGTEGAGVDLSRHETHHRDGTGACGAVFALDYI